MHSFIDILFLSLNILFFIIKLLFLGRLQWSYVFE